MDVPLPCTTPASRNHTPSTPGFRSAKTLPEPSRPYPRRSTSRSATRRCRSSAGTRHPWSSRRHPSRSSAGPPACTPPSRCGPGPSGWSPHPGHSTREPNTRRRPSRRASHRCCSWPQLSEGLCPRLFPRTTGTAADLPQQPAPLAGCFPRQPQPHPMALSLSRENRKSMRPDRPTRSLILSSCRRPWNRSSG